jgi:hypothetical protein
MASEVFKPSEVYRWIRHGDVGKQLEYVFRGVCFVLNSWCSFGAATISDEKLVRKGRYDKPDKGRLTTIEFDKLLNIVCRVWGEMFQRTGAVVFDRMTKLSAEEINGIVRFRPPFQELPGTHGPGQTRTQAASNETRYVVRMLQDLSEEPDLPPYFLFEGKDVRKFEEDIGDHEPDERGDPPEFSHDPHMCFVRPGLAVSDDDIFWDGFTGCERSFLRDLAQALKHLGPTEVRALGVHKDQLGTVEEIQRELKWARRERDAIVASLSSGRIALQNAAQFQVFAEEALRKARLHKEEYASAHDRMLRELNSSPAVRTAFEAVQKGPFEVWGHDDLKTVEPEAECTAAIADYVYSIAYFIGHPKERAQQHTRAAKHARHCWDDGLAALKKCGVRNLFESVGALFDGESEVLRTTTVETLAEVLAQC